MKNFEKKLEYLAEDILFSHLDGEETLTTHGLLNTDNFIEL